MYFSSTDYTAQDFRKESNLFTQFFYDEVYTATGLSWCTEYYYRRLPDGRYRFVMIDSVDNELYANEIFDNAEEFGKYVKDYTATRDLEPYLDDEILSLCPEDIRQNEDELEMDFNEITAALLHDALIEGNRPLVKALLPDFSEFRERLYPSPYIPGISVKELARKKNLYRDYYRSREDYVEEKPDVFVCRWPRMTKTVKLGDYSIFYSTSSPVGASHSSILFEDAKEPNIVR